MSDDGVRRGAERRLREELRREIREGARPFRELRTLVDLGMKECS